jgi:peptidyl-tRNA hydrolase, PTH1 family
MPPSSRLLIASIGNPAPYLSTLHSAGHTVLYALSTALSLPLQKSSRDWAHGLLAHGEEWTLWASPVAMNVSGSAVAAAWKTFLSQSRAAAAGEGEERLVVLHDELEAPLGSVKVRSGSASAKGHNGLKSIRERMPGVEYTRIGIGIGRPESRSPEVVAGYVLRKMTREERGKIEGAVGGVLGELRRLAGG